MAEGGWILRITLCTVYSKYRVISFFLMNNKNTLSPSNMGMNNSTSRRGNLYSSFLDIFIY